MTLADLVPSWERSLRARRRSPRTISDYGKAVAHLVAWLEATGLPTTPAQVGKSELDRYMGEQLADHAPYTALSAYTRLQQFFRWLFEEEEIPVSPFARMSRPTIPDKPVPVLDDSVLKALLGACKGTGFTERRDEAIVRLLIDTGMRRSELAGVQVADVDWKHEVVHVTGKGSKSRACPFGAKTAEALDRYERARRKHRRAGDPAFWLGPKGQLSGSGIAQMLERRATQAGVAHIHPHLFRHTAAHTWLANDGGEGDLMRLMGWSSREMVDRYGASVADQRAQEAHKRKGLGDRV